MKEQVRPTTLQLRQPAVDQIDIVEVMHALADRTRLAIVEQLRASGERACGSFDVEVGPSTLTHHFKVLRDSGLIEQHEIGRRRINNLRTDDLEKRFPGLLASIFDADTQQARPGKGPRPATLKHATGLARQG